MQTSKGLLPNGHAGILWMCGLLLLHSCSLPMETMAAEYGAPNNCMTSWLLSIGISPSRVENYTRLFFEEEISGRALEAMTTEQLEAVGIRAMGARTLIHSAAQAGIGVCRFGGTCELMDSSFACSCPNVTSGSLCEKLADCLPGICANGGECVHEGASVSCACLPGFTGDRCQVTVACQHVPCGNGGTCIPAKHTEEGYMCQCPLGYGGVNCENVWLSEEAVSSLESKITRLSGDVAGVKFIQRDIIEDVASLGTESASLRNVVEEINCPRSFIQWTFLEGKGATDFSYFRIGGREFAAVLTPSNVSVFEIFQTWFFHIQSISSARSHSVKAFSIADGHYMVIAGDTSELYRWNTATRSFDKHQDILTNGALHAEHVTIGTLDFLVFSCSGTDEFTDMTDESPSYVYAWSSQLNRFFLYQRLPTIGAVRATFQSTDSGSFITIDQQSHASESNSTVFKWNGTYFDFLQHFRSNSAYIFAGMKYLFAVSSSAIHRYDPTTGRFVFHSTLPIPQNYTANQSYKYFSINTEHYLGSTGSLSTRSDDGGAQTKEAVTIYRLGGARFTQHQILEGISSVPVSLSGFEARGGEVVLAITKRSGVSFWKWSTCVNP